MSDMFRETPIIQKYVEAEAVETGDSRWPTILRLSCVTTNGSPLSLRISPHAAARLAEAIQTHPLTRNYA
jgi:hypothetical protein